MNITEFEIIIGRDKIASAVGVGEEGVRLALKRGKFSASWFDAIDKLGREKGVDVPRDLFSFKSAAAALEAAQ